MKPLRARIAAEADKAKVPQPVIEKDYALSYILAGLSAQAALRESLIFKGGDGPEKAFFRRLPILGRPGLFSDQSAERQRTSGGDGIRRSNRQASSARTGTV